MITIYGEYPRLVFELNFPSAGVQGGFVSESHSMLEMSKSKHFSVYLFEYLVMSTSLHEPLLYLNLGI